MTELLFAPVLDRLAGPRWWRRLAGMLLLLAPVALVAGLALRWGRPAPPGLAIEADREQWVERGRAKAAAAGLNTTSWNAKVRFEQNEQRLRGSSTGLRRRLSGAESIIVELNDPNAGGRMEARFSPAGDLVSWSIEGGRGSDEKELEAEAAGKLTRAAVEQWLRSYGTPAIKKMEPHGARREVDYRYDVEVGFAEDPGAAYHGQAGWRGSRLVSASITAPEEPGEHPIEIVEGTATGFAVALTMFFVIYSLKLFRQRMREREIPRERVLVLVAAFGICGGMLVALNPDSMGRGPGQAPVAAVGLALLAGIGSSLLFAMGGLLVGAAYASGEGEIREGWPGRVTSFDALLAGRWFTRGVGVSAAIAAATAAWMYFIASLGWRMEPASAAVLIDADVLKLALGRNVLVRSLVDLPVALSFLIVAGLLMPLAFVHRRRWRGWKSGVVLVLCPLLVEAGFRSFALSGIGPTLTTLGMVASLVAPFYLCDLLSAVLGALLYSSLTMASAIATAAPGVADTAAMMLGLVSLGLAPLLASAWWGSEVDEASVRPKHARNLAERLSLRAEVSAAREAQLRLLPDATPACDGLTMAAYCQPAGVVGGDFYDFFAAPEGKLAVFVASGSGLGLASALTIALAKGFLASEVRRGEAPEAALEQLLGELSERVGPAATETGLLLMLVDPAGHVVRVARKGKFPAVWLMRGRECVGLSPGLLEWREGDALIVHTQGLTELLDDQSLSGQREWLEVTARRTEGAAAAGIEKDLTQRLGGRKGKRLRKLRRDVTTLVLRKDYSSSGMATSLDRSLTVAARQQEPRPSGSGSADGVVAV